MKVNAKAKINITHSRRGFQVIEKTWAELVWGWFGPKDSRIPKLIDDLHKNKIAKITDQDGTLVFMTTDPMYIED